MIVCPNCSRQNEDHYKFCLGCGTELSKALAQPSPSPGPEPTTPTPMPTALPQSTPVAPRTPTDPPAAPAPPVEDLAPPIAEGAEETDDASPVPADGSIDLPFDVEPDDGDAGQQTINEAPPAMARPVPASIEPRPTPRAAMPAVVPTTGKRIPRPSSPAQSATSPDSRMCQSCGAVVPEGFKFCGVCGTRYEAPAAHPESSYAPSAVAGEAAAVLVLIHPDGSEGDRFGLSGGETTIGRSHDAPLFAEDPFLSPKHATFFFVKNQLFVRDDGSLNGVFIRIKAEIELFHWDMFRVGQQLLRFEEMSQVRPVQPGAGDGTTVMGSPLRGAWGRLSSVVAIDTNASVWNLRKPDEHIGRERGDIVFPEDGFVSGGHCKLATRDGRYFLADLQSTNGSYLRIKGEGILAPGDLILLGQQLFKVEMSR